MNIRADGSLHFSRFTKADEGVYTVRASNGIGASAVAKTIRLALRSPASVRIEPADDLTLVSGSTAVLRCRVTGDWPLVIRWKDSNDQPIVEGDERLQLVSNSLADGQQQQQQYDLQINRVVLQDGAIYTCEAANDFGADSANVKLIVQGISLYL